jgi:hypothetical protein
MRTLLLAVTLFLATQQSLAAAASVHSYACHLNVNETLYIEEVVSLPDGASLEVYINDKIIASFESGETFDLPSEISNEAIRVIFDRSYVSYSSVQVSLANGQLSTISCVEQ